MKTKFKFVFKKVKLRIVFDPKNFLYYFQATGQFTSRYTTLKETESFDRACFWMLSYIKEKKWWIFK